MMARSIQSGDSLSDRTALSVRHIRYSGHCSAETILHPAPRIRRPMATVDSLKSLLIEQLKDLYDAEKRLTKAFPKLAKASTNE